MVGISAHGGNMNSPELVVAQVLTGAAVVWILAALELSVLLISHLPHFNVWNVHPSILGHLQCIKQMLYNTKGTCLEIEGGCSIYIPCGP